MPQAGTGKGQPGSTMAILVGVVKPPLSTRHVLLQSCHQG